MHQGENAKGLADDYPRFPVRAIKQKFTAIYEERDVYSEMIDGTKRHIFEIMDYLVKAIEKAPEDREFQENFILEELQQYLDKAEGEIELECDHIFDKNDVALMEQIKKYFQYLVISDYVSGMTDGYVAIFHKKIYGDAFFNEKLEEYKRNCQKEKVRDLLQSLQDTEYQEVADKILQTYDEEQKGI